MLGEEAKTYAGVYQRLPNDLLGRHRILRDHLVHWQPSRTFIFCARGGGDCGFLRRGFGPSYRLSKPSAFKGKGVMRNSKIKALVHAAP